MIDWGHRYVQQRREKNFWITQLFKIQRAIGVFQKGKTEAIRRELHRKSTEDIKKEMIVLLKSMIK